MQASVRRREHTIRRYEQGSFRTQKLGPAWAPRSSPPHPPTPMPCTHGHAILPVAPAWCFQTMIETSLADEPATAHPPRKRCGRAARFPALSTAKRSTNEREGSHACRAMPRTRRTCKTSKDPPQLGRRSSHGLKTRADHNQAAEVLRTWLLYCTVSAGRCVPR